MKHRCYKYDEFVGNMALGVSVGKKCLFFGKFGVLYFLETHVLRFALLPYYRRIRGSIIFLHYWTPHTKAFVFSLEHNIKKNQIA